MKSKKNYSKFWGSSILGEKLWQFFIDFINNSISLKIFMIFFDIVSRWLTLYKWYLICCMIPRCRGENMEVLWPEAMDSAYVRVTDDCLSVHHHFWYRDNASPFSNHCCELIQMGSWDSSSIYNNVCLSVCLSVRPSHSGSGGGH